MYTRIGNTDFPTDDSKGRSLEELHTRYGNHVPKKVIDLLYETLNPKQKQPKKKRKQVETKVEKPKTVWENPKMDDSSTEVNDSND